MRRYTFFSVFRIIFLLSMVISATSCITSKKINYLQDVSYKIYHDSVAGSADNDAVMDDYKLQVGDRLFIRVFSPERETALLFGAGQSNMVNMSGASENMDLLTYIIDKDGYIQLPTNKKVHLYNLTLREAKKAVRATLRPLFKHYNSLSVDVKIVGRYFSIIGTSINGRFPIMKEKMNIFQALAMVGNLDTYNDRSKIKIIRQTNGETIVKEFDVRSKNIINSEFYYIQPNDVLYIQDVKEHFFAVTNLAGAISTVFSTLSFGLFFINLFKAKTN